MIKKENLVFLHGWAKRKEDYARLLEFLSEKYTVYALNLPGFGETPIDRPYNLADYAKYVTDFIKDKKIKQVILAGHSNGGRIALKIALVQSNLISKLILIDSGGIERGSWNTKMVKLVTKIVSCQKFLPEKGRGILRQLLGSKDYLAASPVLRETLKNMVNENLEPELGKIKTPTLIIWGREDHTTPLWQGELMRKLIKNSQLKIIEGDHGVPYRKPEEVAKIICSQF
ncbi:alpha/beta hydrolase [Candidatus Gottesmanbacteria bacterium]|nr:alpha/beta hydrolase [Candidatus Gottesmanbacteria bacterium]